MPIKVSSILLLWLLQAIATAQSADTTEKSRPPLVPPALAQASAVPQQRHVTLLVSATDRNGNPLSEFTRQQMSVADNGQAGQVIDVRPADGLPLDLAIVLLASRPDFSQQQSAAVDLVQKLLRPNIDRAFVLVAGGNREWSGSRIEWESDASALERTIMSLDHDAGLPDAFAYGFSSDNAGANRRMNIQYYSTGGNGVFNIIWTMMRTDPRPVRRAAVIFRSAWAHSSGAGNTISQAVDAQHSTVIRDAQQMWIPFYVIGVPEPKTVPAGLSQGYAPIQTGAGGYNRVYDEELEKFRNRAHDSGQVNLERMASETGGKVWWGGKKNYSDVVIGVANAIRSSYAVTYNVPVGSVPGSEHILDIHLNNSEARVRFQKTYFSRQSTSPSVNPAKPDANLPSTSLKPN